MRRSGLLLALAGIVGAVFFWGTDPRYGWLRDWAGTDNAVDAANQAALGTLIGLAGSAAVVVLGLWLALRRRT